MPRNEVYGDPTLDGFKDGQFHVRSDLSYLRPSIRGETPQQKAAREKKRADLVARHLERYLRIQAGNTRPSP